MNRSRFLNNFGYFAIVFFGMLTVLAPLSEPFFAALELNNQLYLHSLWTLITIVLSGIIFSVGWLAFTSDRNWTITLVAIFFLGAGLFNTYHLVCLILLVGVKTASMQATIALTLWARLFTVAVLLVTASASTARNISNFARIGLLITVLAVVAVIFDFMTSNVYPQFLSMLFVDDVSIQMRTAIPAALACAYGMAALLFRYRLRQTPQIWLHKLLLASSFLALAEVNFMLIGTAPYVYPQLGHLVLAFAFVYVYRAVFLYSIQWPIDQMNDWQDRLETSQRELAVTKLAVDGSGYYIFEFDENGKILYVSDNVCRRMGLTQDEMIGTNFRRISRKAPDKLFAPDWSPLNEGDAPRRFELDLVTTTGETFPVANTTTYLKEGDKKHIYAIMEDISDRKHFEAQLAENARFLRRVLDSIPFFVTIATPEGTIVDYNNAVQQSLLQQGSGKPMTGRSMIDFLVPQVINDHAKELLSDAIVQARSGNTKSLELHINQGGSTVYMEFVLAPVRDDAGKVVYLVNTSSNITDRLLAQNELKLASTVFDYSAEAILITDGNVQTLSANRAFSTITGFEELEILGTVPPLFIEGKHLPSMQAALLTAGNWSGEVEWTHKEGHIGYEWITVTKVFDNELAVCNYIVIFSDITEKKRAEEHIQYLAYYDPLTNLPNRVLLDDRVKQAIAGARRDGHKVAVIFLDLDHFKTINDSLGHQCGDKLLTEVAKRLSRSVRESDTVARQSGDEFVIVLPGLEEAETASEVARKLMSELQLPYLVEGVELRVTVSVGVSVFPDDGDDFSKLIMNADAAMYHAKELGRNNVQFFVGEMNRRAAELLDMETRLRRAIELNEFILQFQPQVDLHSNTIASFEALVRWRDPKRGLILPADFISIAESRGLITQIDNYVLRAACHQNRAWQLAGLPKVPIAVNVSAKQFHDRNFVDNIREALAEAELESQYLELEVTETVVMQDSDELLATLDELRCLGVHLAIDDFGMGYSSLSYLKRFPIDKIKIDSSFVRDIPGDKDDYSIVRAIVSLAKQLNLKVVAEGVETIEQLRALQLIDCDEYQGFYFSEPVGAEQAAQLLRTSTEIVPLLAGSPSFFRQVSMENKAD